ncbi:MAG: ATPase [Spirochaetales bacterium]|jgi:vacuolar-type H+-ATPase subunit E/Vma4|nr:ATPase [Spirochaetales bacterium]
MDELQSTEALDREILEDARKKAYRILKSADESAAASEKEWEQKLDSALEKIRSGYDKKAARIRQEIMARLPMDKRRIRSGKIESFLNRAMEGFLKSLDRTGMLRILERELEKRMGEMREEAGEAELRYRNLSSGELDVLLHKPLSGLSLTAKEDPLSAVPGSFPALVIDFPRLRITASADRAAEALLLDKRVELAEALLGEEAHD